MSQYQVNQHEAPALRVGRPIKYDFDRLGVGDSLDVSFRDAIDARSTKQSLRECIRSRYKKAERSFVISLICDPNEKPFVRVTRTK